MRIKELRKQAGLTQEKFAEKIGTIQTTVSAWELGQQEPRSKMLPRIARVFGCKIEDLFDEEELNDQ